MIAMFVWTLSDAIGVIVGVVFIGLAIIVNWPERKRP